MTELKMYVLLRGDIQMSPGKAIAQAGHAYKLLTRKTLKDYPLLDPVYFADGIGTNVTLVVPDCDELLDIWDEIQYIDAPKALVVDEGHIHPPHFDGSKIITALGIGPVYKSDLPESIQNLKLY